MVGSHGIELACKPPEDIAGRYTYEAFVDKQSSKLMLEILKQQKDNDMISKGLPEGTEVAAVVGCDPAREVGILLLLEEPGGHLEHRRREDGVGGTAYLGRVVHER